MQVDFDKGVIKPLKSRVFYANEIEKAIRFFASGQHIGKILIKVRENTEDIQSCPIKVKPRSYFDRKNTIVLLGGLGGVGLELIDWFIFRGCRQLLISSGRGISNNYQKLKIR